MESPGFKHLYNQGSITEPEFLLLEDENLCNHFGATAVKELTVECIEETLITNHQIRSKTIPVVSSKKGK